MDPNMQANGPDGPHDQSGPGDSSNPSFSDLPPPVQQEILAYVLQGKPRNPAVVQQAKTMLENDPDTVAQIMKKLGIGDDSQDDSDNDGDNDNG